MTGVPGSPTNGPYTYDPDYVIPPGATLAEWFEYTGMPKGAIKRYGVDVDTLARLISGEELLTDDLARRLAQFTQIPRRFWLALEHNYRVGLAAGKKVLHG